LANAKIKIVVTSANTAYLISLRYTQMLRTSDDADTLGDIFLKKLFLKCFWWALRNKEFDFFNFLRGGMVKGFLRYRSENDLLYIEYIREILI